MIKGVLIDLSGTIHIGKQPIPGALEAIHRLRREGMPFRFVTNTSRETRAMLHRELIELGLEVPVEYLFTAPMAVRRYLEQEGLRPFLLINPNLEPDFAGLPREDPNAVVVGYARHAFTYANMNAAFRLLKQGAPLIAVGMTRYYQAEDGLDLDAGPFVTALEYAAETRALVLGKPSRRFFLSAVEELGGLPEETVMIGDDADSDGCGALAAGISAILVQTGKYRPGDEEKAGCAGMVTVGDIGAAVEMILAGEISGGRVPQ
jgi:HAD superfamily hydrolase (TIGR01458 family)